MTFSRVFYDKDAVTRGEEVAVTGGFYHWVVRWPSGTECNVATASKNPTAALVAATAQRPKEDAEKATVELMGYTNI